MLISLQGFAQEADWVSQHEDLSEEVEGQEAEGDLEHLEFRRRNKISLNEIQVDELMLFPFVNAYQAEQFEQYRKLLGDFIDVMELQAIPGWEASLVRKILPFVKIGHTDFRKGKILNIFKKGDHQFVLRSSLKKGAGLLGRYQYKNPFFQVGVQVEKDAGEKFIQGSKGISFLSGQLSLSKMGIIRQIVLGDFTVAMAQGLVLGLGRVVRKSSMPMMIKRQQAFLMPYRSTDENRFLRGGGIWLSGKKWEMGAFYSVNNLDGNLKKDTLLGEYVSSLQTSGMHITQEEIMDKNILKWRSIGLMASVLFRKIKLGVHGVHHDFNLPLIKSKDLYNKYALNGRTNSAIGIKAESTFRNIHWFMEMAKDKNGAAAMLAGAQAAIGKQLDISILVRGISKKYKAFWSNSFTEGAEPSDEKGIYTGISFRPFSGVQVDAYADWYKSSWLKYQTNAPIIGFDQLWMIQYKPDRNTIFYIRYKHEVKTEGVSDEGEWIQQIGERNVTGGRIHLERKLSEFWVWRNRVEWTKQQSASGMVSRGTLVYTEWFWKNFQQPFSLNGRLMFCETDDYASRLYAYENDVLYYGLIPAFYGRYFRIYGNINIDLGKSIGVQIKLFQNFPMIKESRGMRIQIIWRGLK